MSGRDAGRGTGPRWTVLERLEAGVFDLLVIGGGIVGSRVAYDASRAGLRTALVDAGDFAGATSGASAGLLHGGLRYLGRGDLALVRAACRERAAFASRIAPHLVRPIPFVAASAGGAVGTARLAAGLTLYAAAGGSRWPHPRPVSRPTAAALVPGLRCRDAAPLAVFHEAVVDDARLTLATVKAAARAGAAVANHVAVRDLRAVPHGLSEAVLSGEDGELRVRARAVVNATGPWTDALRRMEDRRCRPRTRLSKGVHVVLDAGEGWRAALAVSSGCGGHFYAVPRRGMLVLGTTDEEYEGDPGQAEATPAEVASLLEKASSALPRVTGTGAVLSAYAGLRVLPRGGEEAYDALRGHLLSVGSGGMVSVAGGKLTTHRLISRDALRHLPAPIRPRRLPRDAPLPGASPPAVSAAPAPDDPVRRHLRRVYGGEAEEVLSLAEKVPGALEPITPGGLDVWAQVHHAVRSEWAVTVDDVVRRRTDLARRGLDTQKVRRCIADVLPSADVAGHPLELRRPVNVS